MAHHIMVPKEGVAVHINAFNFPIWGMLEKCAVNWMAGMPAVVLPAPQTAYLTEAVVKEIIASGLLPEGALQLISGTARNILDTVQSQDVVTFTGSALVGRALKTHPQLTQESVPFTLEADSLNASILGEDALPGTPEFNIFIKEVRKEMTVKCGQKCTAIRRIIVPENLIEEVQIALGKELDKVTIGDPRLKEVRMGSLVSEQQRNSVREQVKKLAKTASIVYGDLNEVETIGADSKKGAFLKPIVLREDHPLKNEAAHVTEAFGPVSTIMPYKSIEEAVTLAKMGKGSLVSSIVTNDNKIAKEYTINAASHHGRILILNRENAKESTGHGSPLPALVHGGPGRAGGGEEMGGMRGIKHYLQRCAVQGSPTSLTEVTGIYQAKGAYTEISDHPFSYHWEDIQSGMSLKTHKRTITDGDIVNFANLTWDHFYAHTDSRGKEHPSGIVKWYVEVFDVEHELVAIATILTMVQKKQKVFVEMTSEKITSCLNDLTENSKAKWGILTPQHMVEHLEDAYRIASGEFQDFEITTPEKYLEKTLESLYTYEPMAPGYDFPLNKKGALEDLKHSDLDTAKKMMLASREEYLNYFKENPESITKNVVFGDINKYEWYLLERKHLNHHFSQFNLL